MKTMKKILIAALVGLLLLITAAIALPFIFKDKIIAYAVDRANKELTAEIQYDEVNISLLRSFPRISLGLNDFALISKDSTAKFDTISRIDDFYFSINMSDLWKDPDQIEIKEFDLFGGILNLHIDEQGKANYLIYEDPSGANSADSSSTGELKNISLDKYRIAGIDIQYHDVPGDIQLSVKGLKHEGTGNFDAVKFTFDTETSWEDLDLIYDGTSYVSNLKGESRLKLLADTEKQRYELLDNYLKFNELKLESDGLIAMQNEFPEIDLRFSAPETDFSQMLSLIPGIYQHHFKDLDTRGRFSCQGFIKGQIGPDERVPAFELIADVIEGYFKYSELPESVSDINAHIEVRQSGQLLDQTEVAVTGLKISLGGDESSGELFLSQLLSNPKFEGQLKGGFDPDKINQMIYLQDFAMAGDRFEYDIKFSGDQNSVLNEAYEQIDFSGEVSIVNGLIKYASYPELRMKSMQAFLNPKRVELQNVDIEAGKSDVQGEFVLLNPLGYFDENSKPLLTGVMQSESLYADEWLPAEDTKDIAGQNPEVLESPTAVENAVQLVPVDFEIEYKVAKIAAMDYLLTEVESRADYSNDRLNIHQLDGRYDGTSFSIKGRLDQLVDYSLYDGIMMGSLEGKLGTLDLTPFLETDEAGQSENDVEGENYDLALPEKMHISLNFDADRLVLATNQLRNATLKAELSDRKLIISDARGKSFGGSLGLSGILETPKDQKPKMDFHYDMKEIVYEEIFKALESFRKLAPLAEYVNGKFNLNLEFSGLVNDDLSLDLNSIQANGFLNTINASIESFPALKTLSRKFDLGKIENGYQLKNTKNWLEIREGKVVIEEFVRQIGGLEYRIEGSHGIDQMIDYQIRTSIPKDRLKGTGIDRGMDLVVDQANQLGLKLDQADYVDVQFDLNGKFSDPKLGFKVLGVSSGDGRSTTDLKTQTKEQVKEKIEEEKQKAKDRLEEEKRKKEEELRKKIEEEKQRLEEEKKKREEELKKKLEEEKKRKEEELRKRAEEEKEKLKKKLKDLNPFKDGGR